MSRFLFTIFLLAVLQLFSAPAAPLPSETGVLQRASQLSPAEAVKVLRAELGGAPSPAARHLLGVLLYQSGDYRGACEVFRQILEKAPDFTECRSNYAKALSACGLNQEAVEAARLALQQGYTPAVPMLTLLGHNAAACKRWTDAENALRGVLAIEPDNLQAHKQLTVILQSAGRHREAIDFATTAARKYPRERFFWDGIALSAQLCGDEIAAAVARECALRLEAK
jgi:tetratricopeptide (TPR) repeat protein